MEENNTVKATVVGVTPVTPIASPPAPDDSIAGVLKDTIEAISNVIGEFSDEVPKTASTQEEAKAKESVRSFMDFIKSPDFKDTVNETAEKHGVPSKKLAENFFEKTLGTIADVLGLAINTSGNAIHSLINLLSTVLHSATNIIVKVANALVGVVTLNKTCCHA